MIMAGGEMCLLLPNQPLTFGDKMCQLRRRSALPKCLFGPPDPVETEKLLQEQIQRERERFQRRWNIDLDMLEAAIERNQEKPDQKAKEEDVKNSDKSSETESRIPPVPSEFEDRLSSSCLQNEDKTSKGSSGFVPTLKKKTVCKKPASKFQKRVRVAGSHKRQTHLTEFWRSRRSLTFVFGKSKARSVTLQPVKDILESPVLE